MRLNLLENLLKNSISFLTGIKIRSIENRMLNYVFIKTNDISFSKYRIHKSNIETSFFKRFKNYPLSIIDYSGVRWEEDYFDVYFSFYFLKRYIGTVDYIYKNPINSIKTRIVCNVLKIICLFKNFRRQLKISNSIINETKLKIYSFSSDFNPNLCKKIIYFHHLRHKEYLKYIQPSKNKAILISSKVKFQEDEISKYKLYYFKSLKSKKNQSKNFLKEKILYIYLLLLFIIFPNKIPLLFGVLSISLYLKSFNAYSNLALQLFSKIKFENYTCFDSYDLTRALFINKSKYKDKYGRKLVNFIFPHTVNRNSSIIERLSDNIYLPNFFLKKEFTKPYHNCHLYYKPQEIEKKLYIENINKKKNKKLIFLANYPYLMITKEDLLTSYLKTKEIATKLGLDLIFRPHPSCNKPEWIKNIYKISNYGDLKIDQIEDLETSLNSAKIVSLSSYSTTSYKAINSSAICFLTGFEKHLKVFKKFGHEYEDIIGKNLCSNSTQKIINEIDSILTNKNKKAKYFERISSYYSNQKLINNNAKNITELL